MSYYIYFMANEDRVNIHAGISSDIIKTVQAYDEMPNIHYPPKKQNILVYMESLQNKTLALQRMKQFTTATLEQKVEMINYHNPDWIEIKPGVNVEL